MRQTSDLTSNHLLMRTEAVLTPSEIEILQQSQKNPNLFTDYFFRPYGESKGWTFDYQFDEKGAWQRELLLRETLR